jgi:STE24 endopeptidase
MNALQGHEPQMFRAAIAALLIARCAAQLWLERLNRRFVLAHSSSVPGTFRGIIDEPTFQKSNAYTLARNQLQQFEILLDNLVLALVLFTGVLPLFYRHFTQHHGGSSFSLAAFIFVAGFLLTLFDLPLSWYSQFRLEERFGFNTTTQKIWWLDRLKGLILSLLLGYPLLLLILKLVDWMGGWWWLWAWAAMIVFQLVMAVLAPVLIMPLFNKFTLLPEGSLRQRLLALAERARFRAGGIQVMDGSKRSRHSNAFFTGFGRFRKIVLFDTLIQQLTEPELEAVLAHEIGHYKKKHLPKMLVFSAAVSLAGLYLLSLLAKQDWFFAAFGFSAGNIALALLLFGLLSALATFWFSPIGHWWSRRYEYEADAYARNIMSEASSLIGALRKLNEKNLSNLIPHPLYSRFYYSHPTLVEREAALTDASCSLR